MAESSFALDLAKFLEKVQDNSNQVVRKVVLEIGASVIEKSPVGNPDLWSSPPPEGYVGGRFRANWTHGEGSAPTNVFPDIDETGAVSNARIMASVAPDAAGKVHFVVNNLPYAQRLEKGWSTQAPAGMVGLTVSEWQTFLQKAVGEVNK